MKIAAHTLMVCIAGSLFVGGCTARSRLQYRNDTRRLLDARIPQIKACYDAILKTDEKVKGQVVMRFVVTEETGKVTNVEVETNRTKAPDALVECVRASFEEAMVLTPPDKRQGHATFVWEFGTSPSDFGKAGSGDDGPRGGAVATEFATIRPAARFKKTADGKIHTTVLGVIDPATSQPIALEPGTTLVILEDGKEVPLTVVPRDDNAEKVAIDVVFDVDNSGSMGQEADSIAEKIIAFAQLLAKSGLDARFGVVGQNGNITGAFNLGSADAMEAYLAKEKGVQRTMHFGDDAKLSTLGQATRAKYPSAENGISGIQFANANFSWRPEAQRIFINFTDEPTQPNKSRSPWSTTEATCSAWTPTSGNVHLVWSGSSLSSARWTKDRDENPAELSKCTGGVVMSVRSDAKDLDLTTLPMTEALRSSVIVEYESADPEAQHDVVVVVKGTDSEGRTEMKQISY